MKFKKIEVSEVNNGYIVKIDEAIKNSGTRIYKNTEEFKLLEELGEVLLDKRINVDYR